MFNHLLSAIGMNSKVVILKSKKGGIHAATLVELEDKYYYFDTTIERTLFEMQVNNPKKFLFGFVGMGQNEYYEYYSPVGVMPENINDNLLPLPSMVSHYSVPKDIIHSMGNNIRDLTFNRKVTDKDEMER